MTTATEELSPQACGLNTEPSLADDGWATPPPVVLGDGNLVRLFKDGEALRAAYDAIAAAKTSICLEVYILGDDETGHAFVDLLCKQAEAGLKVFVICDSFGSHHKGRTMYRRLRLAGVKFAEFHPIEPWNNRFGWRPMTRDHRKLLVVDDHVGWIGGLNIANEYSGDWIVKNPLARQCLMRDHAIGLVGADAKKLRRAFFKTWRYIHTGGRIIKTQHVEGIPQLPQQGKRVGKQRITQREKDRADRDLAPFAILASAPTLSSPLRPLMHAMIAHATKSVRLIMAYFAPDEALIKALCDTAKRGVRVQLILPARSDLKIMVIAARSFYATLLDAGVEIYERQHVILHAKTLAIDGNLAAIGSTNLDHRSVELNCEISAIVRSETLGDHLDLLLDHDIKHSKRIDPATWRRRPWSDRFVQWFVSRLRYLL